jgi:hypothetical protein
MASPPIGAPAEQPLLPDEIMEEIFLCLDSGYDLARACTACRTFRRVATGRLFLRRFLSLHPPPIVGFINLHQNRGFKLSEPPHRSARCLGDFTFSFLPSASHPNSTWCTRNVRDGRFLLTRENTDASTFLELVVCDPLHRRYVQIPPIPGDLVPGRPTSCEKKSEPFLAPTVEEESEEDSHFQVIYNWLSDYKVVSFVFSSATGTWCCATSFSFLPERLILRPTKLARYYAHGCFYWVNADEGHMLMLDLREMFSFLEPPYERTNRKLRLAIIDSTEHRLGLVIIGGLAMIIRDLYSKSGQNNGVGEEWRHHNSIPLLHHQRS